MSADDQPAANAGESTSARLRRVEQELEYAVNRNHMLLRTTAQAQDDLRQQLAASEAQLAAAREQYAEVMATARKVDPLRAELASAQSELAALRTQLDQHRTTPEVTP